MIKFIKKQIKKDIVPIESKPEEVKKVTKPAAKNKAKKEPKNIMDEQKISKAEEVMNNLISDNHVKIVKKDKGLIERTESSKIVLTEDNRQILGD